MMMLMMTNLSGASSTRYHPHNRYWNYSVISLTTESTN
ncbi:hypothetical protein AHF37_09164 [Paragonimus kellicotti]|nr:hypothetical protein AHF37_09164 [Paragonimus kellicotti]